MTDKTTKKNEDDQGSAAFRSKKRTLLIVDDDRPFLNRLAQAMERRGFVTVVAETFSQAIAAIEQDVPSHAVIDLRLDDGYGLDIVPELRRRNSDMRIIILTGYFWRLVSKSRLRPPIRCRSIRCGGNMSKGFLNCVTGTSRRRLGG